MNHSYNYRYKRQELHAIGLVYATALVLESTILVLAKESSSHSGQSIRLEQV